MLINIFKFAGNAAVVSNVFEIYSYSLFLLLFDSLFFHFLIVSSAILCF